MAGISQAYICWAAARNITAGMAPDYRDKYPGVSDTYINACAAAMDDIFSSSFSHKYVSDEVHALVHDNMGIPKGHGIYGAYRFKDGSKIYIITTDFSRTADQNRYLIEDPDGQITERRFDLTHHVIREATKQEAGDATSV